MGQAFFGSFLRYLQALFELLAQTSQKNEQKPLYKPDFQGKNKPQGINYQYLSIGFCLRRPTFTIA